MMKRTWTSISNNELQWWIQNNYLWTWLIDPKYGRLLMLASFANIDMILMEI
jgi:hypothetical protein